MGFREECREWLEENCPASIRTPMPENEGVGGGRRATYPNPDTKLWMDRMAEKGWTAPMWPTEYGGGGLNKEDARVLQEELGRIKARPAHTGMGLSMIGPALLEFGTEEQKQEHLPKIVRGDIWWCQGYSEPGSGSDLASLQTKAVEDGDEYIINGQKVWNGAQRGDMIHTLVRTDPDAPKHRGISYIMIDLSAKGVTINPLWHMNGLGRFNEVFFEDVKVPLSSRVGEENRGWYIAVTSLDFERSGIHLIIGIQGVYEKLIHFLKSKLASKIGIDTNRLKKIARTLTDTKLELEVARLLSYRITSMQSAGLVPNYEASMAKCMGSELGQFHARRAINALGLYGQLLKDSKHSVLNGDIPNSYMYTVSRTIAGGTSEIQRNIIATRGLGLPRS